LAVAKVLRAGQGLTVLDLSHNMLTDVGVAAVCGAILADESDHAVSLHSDAATAVDEPATRPLPFRLQSLGLAGNQMTDNGLQKLCHALGELTKLHQDLGSGHYTLPLTELQLGSNRLGDEGGRKLARFFNMHMDALKLEHIDLSHAGMTARGVSLILSALATSCQSLSTLNIKGNGSVNVHVIHALTRLLVEAPKLISVQSQLSKQNSLDMLADKEAVAAVSPVCGVVHLGSAFSHATN
jgi:Ran GTPase-activating protein (RanGAP) involved in mRNA processing and transport